MTSFYLALIRLILISYSTILSRVISQIIYLSNQQPGRHTALSDYDQIGVRIKAMSVRFSRREGGGHYHFQTQVFSRRRMWF